MSLACHFPSTQLSISIKISYYLHITTFFPIKFVFFTTCPSLILQKQTHNINTHSVHAIYLEIIESNFNRKITVIKNLVCNQSYLINGYQSAIDNFNESIAAGCLPHRHRPTAPQPKHTAQSAEHFRKRTRIYLSSKVRFIQNIQQQINHLFLSETLDCWIFVSNFFSLGCWLSVSEQSPMRHI